jgi:hypothetical protein
MVTMQLQEVMGEAKVTCHIPYFAFTKIIGFYCAPTSPDDEKIAGLDSSVTLGGVHGRVGLV